MDLTKALESAQFRKSPGYTRKKDGARIGPHEYVTFYEHATLFSAFQKTIKGNPDAYYREYNGRKYRCLNIDGYRYWVAWPALNRCPLKKRTKVHGHGKQTASA